jgi:hypothetical protein
MPAYCPAWKGSPPVARVWRPLAQAQMAAVLASGRALVGVEHAHGGGEAEDQRKDSEEGLREANLKLCQWMASLLVQWHCSRAVMSGRRSAWKAQSMLCTCMVIQYHFAGPCTLEKAIKRI